MSPRPVLGSKRRATGPRTPEGRKRAAQNARRHGLTSISPNHAVIAAQVDDWIEGVDLAVVPLASLIRLAEVRFQVAAVRDHQAALLEQLCGFCDAEADQECTAAPRKKALIADIVTGQMRPNWEIIEAQDPSFVEYDEVFQNKGGIHTRTMGLRKRGTFDATKFVLQLLESLLQNSGLPADRLTQAYMELIRKGSKSPIATEVSD